MTECQSIFSVFEAYQFINKYDKLSSELSWHVGICFKKICVRFKVVFSSVLVFSLSVVLFIWFLISSHLSLFSMITLPKSWVLHLISSMRVPHLTLQFLFFSFFCGFNIIIKRLLIIKEIRNKPALVCYQNVLLPILVVLVTSMSHSLPGLIAFTYLGALFSKIRNTYK